MITMRSLPRSPVTDLYALLQVSPRASAEEISAAYQRLRALYAPERVAEAAPDVQALAAQRREQLDAAYAVLSDPHQRAAYDRRFGFAASEEALDYRPLPPARGQERSRAPEERDSLPAPARLGQGPLSWLPALGIAVVGLALLLLLVLSGVRTTSDPAAMATPTVAMVRLPFTEAQLAQFRSAAENNNTFEAWRAYGNALFDNLQTMRENAAQAPQYRNQLDRWQTVIEAYDRALQLRDDPIVRADRALSLFNYGVDAAQAAYVEQATAAAEEALQQGVSAPRALLNYGLILSLSRPPRTEEALALWRRITVEAPNTPEAQRAQALLQSFEGQSAPTGTNQAEN